jgi:hypothetical protein
VLLLAAWVVVPPEDVVDTTVVSVEDVADVTVVLPELSVVLDAITVVVSLGEEEVLC